MKKGRTVFVCAQCGYEAPKWLGKCPGCDSWNSFFEQAVAPPSPVPGGDPDRRRNHRPVLLSEVSSENEMRFLTHISELDRVLGGGVVRGSFVLVGGEPGIGKSTLLLQMCRHISTEQKVLYISGEESLKQIKLRAERINVDKNAISAFAETELGAIFAAAESFSPDIMIVDSIQTVYKSELDTAPGNIAQVKECAMALMQYSKANGVTVFIVGHVNKDGAIAGPKVLEHMVDCVLYFEGEKYNTYRVIRSAKNRYGSTNEIGVFEMTGDGLKEVKNPSEALLSGRPKGASGNCVVAVMEGTRPILAEIQALVTKTSFGMPRRMSTGMDYNRMVLLMAILEKRAGLPLSNYDAYVNIVGGLRVDEPAADLAAAIAIASSFRDAPVPEHLAAFGEVGLSGELRAVSGVSQRLSEIRRLGFKTCVMPYQRRADFKAPEGLEVITAKNICEALQRSLQNVP